ncbi:hypothetical protein AV530_005794 [Patagioenas fasciata monilis]|uniref:Uncharacterized protein n=1 Tax=Patagioenas fasciata monilis TaxID=372326 RepID=A0A1V4JN34_PATFA|nr:hypothetical protein AV530_005794 [Patagioenas fasciata monilis]
MVRLEQRSTCAHGGTQAGAEKFGFNNICRLEKLKNLATSQAEGSETFSGKQKGIKDLNSSKTYSIVLHLHTQMNWSLKNCSLHTGSIISLGFPSECLQRALVPERARSICAA